MDSPMRDTSEAARRARAEARRKYQEDEAKKWAVRIVRGDEQQVQMPEMRGSEEAVGRWLESRRRERMNPRYGLSDIERRPSVYFLLTEDETRLKIGKSKTPRKRIYNLRMTSPVWLEIAAIVPGYSHVELWLHQRFSKYRLHGEWFKYEGELRETVEALGSVRLSIQDLNPFVVRADEADQRLSNTI